MRGNKKRWTIGVFMTNGRITVRNNLAQAEREASRSVGADVIFNT